MLSKLQHQSGQDKMPIAVCKYNYKFLIYMKLYEIKIYVIFQEEHFSKYQEGKLYDITRQNIL